MPPILRPRKPTTAVVEPTMKHEKPEAKTKKKSLASKPLAQKQVTGTPMVRKTTAGEISRKTPGETPIQGRERSNRKGKNEVAEKGNSHGSPPRSSFQVVIIVVNRRCGSPGGHNGPVKGESSGERANDFSEGKGELPAAKGPRDTPAKFVVTKGLATNDPPTNRTSASKKPVLKNDIRKWAGAESTGAPRTNTRGKSNRGSTTAGRKSAVEKAATQKRAEHDLSGDESESGHSSGEGSDESYKPSRLRTRPRRAKQKYVGGTRSQASRRPTDTTTRDVAVQSVQRGGVAKTAGKPAEEKMSAGLVYAVATRSSTAREAAMRGENEEGKREDNGLFEEPIRTATRKRPATSPACQEVRKIAKRATDCSAGAVREDIETVVISSARNGFADGPMSQVQGVQQQHSSSSLRQPLMFYLDPEVETIRSEGPLFSALHSCFGI